MYTNGSEINSQYKNYLGDVIAIMILHQSVIDILGLCVREQGCINNVLSIVDYSNYRLLVNYCLSLYTLHQTLDFTPKILLNGIPQIL